MTKKRKLSTLICILLILCLAFSTVLTGCQGTVGPQGEKGETGATGAQGPAGKDGKDGTNGKDGVDGKDLTSIIAAPELELIDEGVFVGSGVSTLNLANKANYYPSASTKADADAIADKLNRQIADEGQVLLYNNGALPFESSERNISLMGIASQDIVVAGGGSGSASQNAQSTKYDWNNAFAEEGFRLNPKLVNMYKSVIAKGAEANAQYLEIGMENYGASVVSTYYGYSDAAVVVLHRWGTENADLATYNAKGHSNKLDTQLDLQDNEIALIKHAKANFNKVIVILNTSNTMDVSELAMPKNTELGVDAILWVGGVGQVGCLEAVRILKGEVNPSGHLPDTWWADLKADPAFTNVSIQSQNEEADGSRSDAFFYYNGEQTTFALVEYRENIYMGHYYYETVYEDMINHGGKSKAEADAWYDSVVAFPFGSGESYTTFDWQLAGKSKNTTITSNAQLITIKVQVTNTGKVAGKDVVQLYASAPYYNGGIEKPAAKMMGFAKTRELQPGESEIVSIQIKAQDFASYDWNDANNNGFSGYELEHGKYVMSIRRDSHNVEFAVDYEVKDDIKCQYDLETGAKVENVFTDDGYMDFSTVRDDYLENMATRKDYKLSQPKFTNINDRALTEAEYEILMAEEFYTPYNDEEGQPWFVKDAASLPTNWTQSATAASTAELTALRAALSGVPYHEPTVVNGVVSFGNLTAAERADNAKWDAYMNALTYDQLVTYYSGAAGPLSGGLTGSDGPVTFGSGADWSTCPISAATWNLELIEEQGEMLGTQAMLNGTTGWRGGGIDTHRTPFNGRCFEYYSEDGILASYIAKAVDTGVTSKGIMCYWKHFFCNDQEYRRANFGGVSVFVTEQAAREIYAKPFETVIKNGTAGIMTSFNRFGFIVNSNNYATHQKLLRDEWGYRGGTVNDRWCKAFCPQDLMLRAGDTYLMGSWNEYPDGGITWGKWDATARGGLGIVLIPTAEECEVAGGNNKKDGSVASPTQYYVIRLAAARDIYNEVNSMVMKNNTSGIVFTATAYAGINAKYQITSEKTNDVSITSVNVGYPTEAQLDGIVPTVEEISIGSGWRVTKNYIYTFAGPEFTYKETRSTNTATYNVSKRELLPPVGASKFTFNGYDITVSATSTTYTKGVLSVTVNNDGINNIVAVNAKELGEYTIPVICTVDSWITGVVSEIKVNVVSPLCINGEEISTTGKTVTVNKGSEIKIDSDYYRYMDLESTNKHLVIAAYSANGATWMGRHEDASAADIVTIEYKDTLQKREPSYTVTLEDGTALPSGFSVENIMITPMGFAGLKYSSEIVDGVTLKVGSSVAAGTYQIKVVLNTYTTNKPTGGSWFNASGVKLQTVTQIITVIVK